MRRKNKCPASLPSLTEEAESEEDLHNASTGNTIGHTYLICTSRKYSTKASEHLKDSASVEILL